MVSWFFYKKLVNPYPKYTKVITFKQFIIGACYQDNNSEEFKDLSKSLLLEIEKDSNTK